MKLSIIIPTYNRINYLLELFDNLDRQITDDVEVFIINDGSTDDTKERLAEHIRKYNKGQITIINKENGGVSSARNVGLEMAKGTYIDFIDSDDNIVEGYIKRMLEMCNLGLDYFYKSWKRFGGDTSEVIIRDHAPDWNCAVWTRCIKRNKIGNIRFDESLKACEDAKFVKQVLYSGQKYTHGAIVTPIYLYRCGDPTSLSNTVLKEMAKAKAEREKNEKK